MYETVRNTESNPSGQNSGTPLGGSSSSTIIQPPVEVRALTRSSTSIVLNWLDQDLLSANNQNKRGNKYYNVSIR